MAVPRSSAHVGDEVEVLYRQAQRFRRLVIQWPSELVGEGESQDHRDPAKAATSTASSTIMMLSMTTHAKNLQIAASI
jgi:hypothetical protein